MKTSLFFIVLFVYLFSVDACHKEAIDFCALAQSSDKKLASAVDHYFQHDDQEAATASRFQTFTTYLSAQACITDVVLARAYLRTSPPQKEVFITFDFGSGSMEKRLRISVNDQKLTTTISP